MIVASNLIAVLIQTLSAKLGPEQTAAIDADAAAWFENHHLALMFIEKDGPKWRDSSARAAVTPDQGVFTGRLVPTDPSLMFEPVHRPMRDDRMR